MNRRNTGGSRLQRNLIYKLPMKILQNYNLRLFLGDCFGGPVQL